MRKPSSVPREKKRWSWFAGTNWLYSEDSGIVRETGSRIAWARVTTPEQEEYFTKIGFKPDKTALVPERYSYSIQ